VNKKYTFTSFVAIRKKRPEEWRTNSWFLLNDNAPAHRSVWVKDLLAKNNVTTLEHPSHSPDLAAAAFYLFLVGNQRWRDGAFVMLLTSLRMRHKNLKSFRKTSSTNVSPPLHSLAEVCSCRGGLFWRKCSFNDCNLLHFSEIKWFPDDFEATSHVGVKINKDSVVDNYALLGCYAVSKAIYYRRSGTSCRSHRDLYFVPKRRYQIANNLYVKTKKSAVCI